jgi:hypothetical protein
MIIIFLALASSFYLVIELFDTFAPVQAKESPKNIPLSADYENARNNAKPIGYFHKAFEWR